MKKTKVVLLVCFFAALAAGVSLGYVARETVRPHPPHRTWLTEELNLTPDQREKMRKIWSETMGKMHERFRNRRDALREKREAAIREMLTPEQLKKYEEINAAHRQEIQKLFDERKKLIDEAVAKTKAILTAEQLPKYEELRRQREKNGSWFTRGRGTGGKIGASPPGQAKPSK